MDGWMLDAASITTIPLIVVGQLLVNRNRIGDLGGEGEGTDHCLTANTESRQRNNNYSPGHHWPQEQALREHSETRAV